MVDPIWFFSEYHFSFYSLFLILTGIFMLLQGLFVLYQNCRSKAHIAFSLVALSCFIWLTGTALESSSSSVGTGLFWMRYYTNYGVFAIAPSIYFFSVAFSGVQNPTRRLLIIFGYTITLAFSFLISFTDLIFSGMDQFYWGLWPRAGSLRWLYHVYFFLYYLASLWNFYQAYKNEKNALRRKHFALLMLAFSIALLGGIDYLPEFGLEILPMGFVFVISFVFVMFYSIIHYKLLDIETVIHKTIMWAVTSILFAGPVVLFSYLGRNWLLGLDPASFSSVVFGLIIFFIVYARLVQPRIDHAFQRRRWDLLAVLERFTDELVHLRELEGLLAHIVDTIRNVFYVEAISLFLSKDENSGFQAVKGLPEETQFQFERTHPFISWLESHDLVVLREYLDLDPRYELVKEAAKEYFERVNAYVSVPLVVNEKLLGIINIGRKSNLKRFGKAEIDFLSDLRKTAAIALSNSLRSIAMQESLRRWNVELEKKVEERTKELQDTQAQLIQAEKLASIGTLAGGIAHEINNPLTAVLTNVQMLKMLNEGHDAESLSLIEEGAKRCQQIIQKLMRYARKTDEVQAPDRVDVNNSIRTICDFLGYQLKQENIDLELSLTPVEPVAAIAGELEQVFTNLILNAKDAIRSAGRKGTIRFRTEQKDGWVIIQVSDNGIGIKKENLVRIFDPFFTTKDVGEGTGLGLTVSSGIVEKHRGKISVISEDGRGTAFTVQFPQAKEKIVPARR